MLRFVVRRLAWAIFVLWVVMSSVFVMVNVIGDPAAAALGAKASPEQLHAFRERHGLNAPLGERYGSYLVSLSRFDLGRSFQDEQPVLELIGRRLPRTMLLGALALGFELLIGLSLGTLAALFKNTWFDTGAMALAFLGISLPTFVTGLWFLSYFAFRLGWFPVGGYGIDAFDHVHHAILPAMTLAVVGAATYARVMRGEMIEALRSDYVRTAHAKGVGPVRVILAHGARNAVLPVITLMGISLRMLVSGAIITEAIFAWPGIGRLSVEAISGLDLPVVLGIVFIACAAVQLGNVLADIAVAVLDPRIRET
jgi:peptide/nickel transport system permease protein